MYHPLLDQGIDPDEFPEREHAPSMTIDVLPRWAYTSHPVKLTHDRKEDPRVPLSVVRSKEIEAINEYMAALTDDLDAANARIAELEAQIATLAEIERAGDIGYAVSQSYRAIVAQDKALNLAEMLGKKKQVAENRVKELEAQVAEMKPLVEAVGKLEQWETTEDAVSHRLGWDKNTAFDKDNPYECHLFYLPLTWYNNFASPQVAVGIGTSLPAAITAALKMVEAKEVEGG